MHTQSSQTYRQHAIPGHKQQVFASMMALSLLRARYGRLVRRHEALINKALEHMTGVV